MNQLTPYQPQAPAVAGEDYTAFLPSWINYLIAAYPQTKTAARTYAVLEDQFDGVDEGLMNRVVRKHVAKSEWWPATAQLREILTELEREPLPLSPADAYKLNMARIHRQLEGVDKDELDEEIASWEVARGTMPPAVLEAIESEQPVNTAVEEVEWVELFA